MNVESELKNVLRRIDPPRGFADRVMRKVEDRQSCLSGSDLSASHPPRQAGLPVLHKALAAAALIAAMLGGWGVHETLRARNELLLAMRIASQKVAHAQQEIRK